MTMNDTNHAALSVMQEAHRIVDNTIRASKAYEPGEATAIVTLRLDEARAALDAANTAPSRMDSDA